MYRNRIQKIETENWSWQEQKPEKQNKTKKHTHTQIQKHNSHSTCRIFRIGEQRCDQVSWLALCFQIDLSPQRCKRTLQTFPLKIPWSTRGPVTGKVYFEKNGCKWTTHKQNSNLCARRTNSSVLLVSQNSMKHRHSHRPACPRVRHGGHIKKLMGYV